MSVLLH